MKKAINLFLNKLGDDFKTMADNFRTYRKVYHNQYKTVCDTVLYTKGHNGIVRQELCDRYTVIQGIECKSFEKILKIKQDNAIVWDAMFTQVRNKINNSCTNEIVQDNITKITTMYNVELVLIASMEDTMKADIQTLLQQALSSIL